MSETPKSPAPFYGWFVVACFVLTLVLGPRPILLAAAKKERR